MHLPLCCVFCFSSLFTFDDGFLFTHFTVSMLECQCVIEEQRRKLNLEKGCKEPLMLFHILKCLCSSNIARKWGTPYLWCKSLWCVYKCYFQICFPLSNFSFCLCSTILCFLHFNHLGSQRLVFVFMSLSYEST